MFCTVIVRFTMAAAVVVVVDVKDVVVDFVDDEVLLVVVVKEAVVVVLDHVLLVLEVVVRVVVETVVLNVAGAASHCGYLPVMTPPCVHAHCSGGAPRPCTQRTMHVCPLTIPKQSCAYCSPTGKLSKHSFGKQAGRSPCMDTVVPSLFKAQVHVIVSPLKPSPHAAKQVSPNARSSQPVCTTSSSSRGGHTSGVQTGWVPLNALVLRHVYACASPA
mmetsp:Transcript_52573/g.159825  ORF Transcript_52573/g.159825 Transcript_52573/m.159825 type:complete len:217 (+) Transcript_52573:830-1480(+)